MVANTAEIGCRRCSALGGYTDLKQHRASRLKAALQHWRESAVQEAIATATTMALWNIWLHCLVVKHLGVKPSIVFNIFLTPDID